MMNSQFPSPARCAHPGVSRPLRGSLVGMAAAIAAALLFTSCDEQKKLAEVVTTAKGLYTYDPQQAVYPKFSGEKALAFVQEQVDVGPRPSGSEGAERCRQLLEKTLKGFGWDVQRQSFKDYTPNGNVEFHNIRARFPMPGSDTWKRDSGVLLCSHYDTKIFSFPFVGANDAGSSTGALLEMGRVLSSRPALAQFVELVFFDGEEAVVEYTLRDGLYGSRHYVAEMKKRGREMAPLAMILLDMVGEKNVRIEMPRNSHPGIVRGLLNAATELKYEKSFAQGTEMITDDHLPFHVAGIPCVDIIDLNYPVWHLQGDTMDKLSAESLEIVGRTTLLALEKTFLSVSSWE